MNTTGRTDDRSVDDDTEPIPAVVEWLVGGVLAIGGLLLALGGSAILWASDDHLMARAIEEGIADGSIQTDVLTADQLVAVASETTFWLGAGFVVTGLGIVVVAIGYLLGRRRTRRSAGGGNSREILFAHALLGAIATGLLSFLPVSPVFGGGIAGYVHRRAGSATKAGAVSGLLATLPVAVIGTFLAVGLASGLDQGEVQGLGPVVALAVIVGVIVALVYFVGLGALGGYIAAVIADDDHTTADDGGRIDADDGGGIEANDGRTHANDGARTDAGRSSDERPTDSVDASGTHDPAARDEGDGTGIDDSSETGHDERDASRDRR